jgi:NitT/TauT family transport system ATP-binding protein
MAKPATWGDAEPRGGVAVPPALALHRVAKKFQARPGTVEALAPLDLAVAAGEFVCLVGPSGCGKSTLLSLIAGLDSPTHGTIRVGGRRVSGPGTDRVLLSQDAALFPWLDVQRNVEFGLRQQGMSAVDRAKVARYWMGRVSLDGLERNSVRGLSGGIQQRVALARALAIEPSVLLMDEPFGTLDAMTRDRLHAELQAIWASTRKTIVFVTHNTREAVALGDRVLVLAPHPGSVVAEFRVDLPRPRTLEDTALVERTRVVLRALRSGAQEEFGTP